MADLEDLGGPAKQPRAKADVISASEASTGNLEPKQMLSPPLRAALSKQGYKLVGAALTCTTQTYLCSLLLPLAPQNLPVTGWWLILYLEAVLGGQAASMVS